MSALPLKSRTFVDALVHVRYAPNADIASLRGSDMITLTNIYRRGNELPPIIHPLPLCLLGGLGVLSGSALDEPDHISATTCVDAPATAPGHFFGADYLSVDDRRSFPVASV